MPRFSDERKRWANKSMARPRFQFGPGGARRGRRQCVSDTGEDSQVASRERENEQICRLQRRSESDAKWQKERLKSQRRKERLSFSPPSLLLTVTTRPTSLFATCHQILLLLALSLFCFVLSFVLWFKKFSFWINWDKKSWCLLEMWRGASVLVFWKLCFL